VASIYQLKPAFQNLLRPCTRALARNGITANVVTVSTCVLSLALGVWIWISHASQVSLIALPIFLYLRMALNAIDGMLAREHGMKSHLGAILNELTDVIEDGALYLPLSLIPGINVALVVSILLLGALSEMAGVVAVSIGASRRYDGPMGKSDRAFVFGSVALITGLGLQWQHWIDLALWITLFLSILTPINRSKKALQEAK
jgi:CDP-diacylglycerol--glycerol-3-phosphate 3-phosphatidyltransferase